MNSAETAVLVVDALERLLDFPYIRRWCEQHGTRELLDRLLASLPK